MKVAWSVLVSLARGKVGSVAAVDTWSGPVLRSCYRARMSNTQLQLSMRAALGGLATLWSDPTMAPHRADWIALGLAHPEACAGFADVYKTGFQWFVRANTNRAQVGEAIILAAPAFAAVGDPGALTLAHATGPPEELNVSATSPPAAGHAVMIMATPALSPGIYTLGHQQRKLSVINPGTSGPWNIFADYTARFGTPADGKQVFVEVWYVHKAQGRIGLKSQAGALW